MVAQQPTGSGQLAYNDSFVLYDAIEEKNGILVGEVTQRATAWYLMECNCTGIPSPKGIKEYLPTLSLGDRKMGATGRTITSLLHDLGN